MIERNVELPESSRGRWCSAAKHDRLGPVAVVHAAGMNESAALPVRESGNALSSAKGTPAPRLRPLLPPRPPQPVMEVGGGLLDERKAAEGADGGEVAMDQMLIYVKDEEPLSCVRRRPMVPPDSIGSTSPRWEFRAVRPLPQMPPLPKIPPNPKRSIAKSQPSLRAAIRAVSSALAPTYYWDDNDGVAASGTAADAARRSPFPFPSRWLPRSPPALPHPRMGAPHPAWNGAGRPHALRSAIQGIAG